jgi:hypothetical protein
MARIAARHRREIGIMTTARPVALGVLRDATAILYLVASWTFTGTGSFWITGSAVRPRGALVLHTWDICPRRDIADAHIDAEVEHEHSRLLKRAVQQVRRRDSGRHDVVYAWTAPAIDADDTWRRATSSLARVRYSTPGPARSPISRIPWPGPFS